MGLIDAYTAARHLKANVGDPEFIEEISPKIEQATAIVLKHVREPDAAWTSDTDPADDQDFAIVQAAVLKVLMNLYAFRGDEIEVKDPFSDDVKRLLMSCGLLDPTVA